MCRKALTRRKPCPGVSDGASGSPGLTASLPVSLEASSPFLQVATAPTPTTRPSRGWGEQRRRLPRPKKKTRKRELVREQRGCTRTSARARPRRRGAQATRCRQAEGGARAEAHGGVGGAWAGRRGVGGAPALRESRWPAPLRARPRCCHRPGKYLPWDPSD